MDSEGSKTNENMNFSTSKTTEDPKEIIKFIKELLECPVCLTKIKSIPIFQCTNGHVTCKDCIPKCDSCPECRSNNEPVRSLKLEKIVMKINGIQQEHRTTFDETVLKWKKPQATQNPWQIPLETIVTRLNTIQAISINRSIQQPRTIPNEALLNETFPNGTILTNREGRLERRMSSPRTIQPQRRIPLQTIATTVENNSRALFPNEAFQSPRQIQVGSSLLDSLEARLNAPRATRPPRALRRIQLETNSINGATAIWIPDDRVRQIRRRDITANSETVSTSGYRV